ncbi:hypothetical protein IJI99_01870 [bacterium]|nr:hypothetical protein [bacterium]
MSKQKNTPILIIICLLIALVAYGCYRSYAHKYQQVHTNEPAISPITTVPTTDTSSLTAEQAFDYLKNLDTMVYRVTYTDYLPGEDDQGNSSPTILKIFHHVSVTPTLTVNQDEGNIRTSSEGEESNLGQDYPAYYVTNPDGSSTSYAHGDKWYTGHDPANPYRNNTDHFIADTWAITQQPQAVADNVFQAPDYYDPEATYHFYFTNQKLTKVEWTKTGTQDTIVYEILDEAPITNVPQEVINAAVPFEM